MTLPRPSANKMVSWTSKTDPHTRRKIFYCVAAAEEKFEQEDDVQGAYKCFTCAKAVRCISKGEKCIISKTWHLVTEEDTDLILDGMSDVRKLLEESREKSSFNKKTDRSIKRSLVKQILPEKGLEMLMFRFERHVLRLQLAPHPNSLNYQGVGKNWTRQPGLDVFFVCEDVVGTALPEYLRQTGALSPAELVSLARDVGSVLASRHARNITHGCLGPRHILLDSSGHWRVDGWEECLVAEAKSTLFGEPEPGSRDSALLAQADVWALGLALLCAALGGPLALHACHMTPNQDATRVLVQTLSATGRVAQSAQDFIICCLASENDRCSAANLMAHDFLRL